MELVRLQNENAQFMKEKEEIRSTMESVSQKAGNMVRPVPDTCSLFVYNLCCTDNKDCKIIVVNYICIIVYIQYSVSEQKGL